MTDASGRPTLFDLDDSGEWPLSDKGRRPNLSRAFVQAMEAKLGLRFVPEKPLPDASGRGWGGVDNAAENKGWSHTHTPVEQYAITKDLAREMRKEQTPAEEKLWQRLRKNHVHGYKFRRQHTVGPFIVDFYCAQAGLVVEVDGSIHEQQEEYDAMRQAYLESLGIRVLRFTNGDVLQQIDGVIERIGEVLLEIESNPTPQPPPQSIEEGEQVFYPEDILHYAYAIFHSPTYRERYAEFLKIDFPRLPLTADVELFRSLAGLGSKLVALHLMTHPALDDFITTFPEAGDNEISSKGGYPKYDAKTQRVNINKTQYFEGVPPEVWNFYVGGYQVLDKWLKDRRGRELSFEGIMHYQRIVVALKETMRLMGEIDAAIPAWPVE